MKSPHLVIFLAIAAIAVDIAVYDGRHSRDAVKHSSMWADHIHLP